MEAHGDQFQRLLDEYTISKKDFDKGCKLMEYISKNKIGQHCEVVAEFGIHVAQQMSGKLQDPSFADRIEEFYLACLEMKLIDWAQVFLKSICMMFPNNVKSMRFLAMWYEAQGNNFRAQEIYQELLESCP